MWRESIGFFAAAVAVINGLFAIVIALLPVRRSVVKLRMAVVALGLSLVAVVVMLGGTYYAHYLDQRAIADQRDIRERLEGFVSDGRKLLAQIRDPQQELPNLAADQWAQQAELYLRDKFGEISVARFRKELSDMYGDAAVPASRLAYWRAVRNRVFNLEAMAGELPSPIRSSTVATPKL